MERKEMILLVEDEPAARAAAQAALAAQGYEVCTAATLAEARRQLEAAAPALVVLDILMPDGSGLDFCRELRRGSAVPILFLTVKGQPKDITNGLYQGGDDYLAKPWSTDELCARVAALLRRSRMDARVCVGHLELDYASQSAFYRGASLELRPKEFLLLAALARRTNSFVPVDTLHKEVWGRHATRDARTVLVNLSTLRGKLKQAAAQELKIERDMERGFRLRFLAG